MASLTNSSATSASATSGSATNPPEQLPLKGLKFHTLILFKDTSGNIIDMLTVDNDFSNERLKEYREKYQYGNVNPDGLSAPTNIFEWWKQLDVKKYLKDQMEKDYLMSLYTDDPSKSTTIKPSYYTLSVNTDKDVINFMDFLNDLRTQMSTLYGVRYFGGALTPKQTALKTMIDKIKNDYTTNSTTYTTNKTWKNFIDLPVVTEIIGKAAIKELSKASKTPTYGDADIGAIISEAATSAASASVASSSATPPLAASASVSNFGNISPTSSLTNSQASSPTSSQASSPTSSPTNSRPSSPTTSATLSPKQLREIRDLKTQALDSLMATLPTFFHQNP